MAGEGGGEEEGEGHEVGSIAMTLATASRLAVQALRAQFPLLDQQVNGRPLVYLDNAATSQRPAAVLDAMANYYLHDNANVHRGLYELARRSTDRYEAARATVARFIHAPSAGEVVFVRGVTEAVNLVATAWGDANLGPGDEILLTVTEHHSNIVPWQLAAQRTGAVLRYLDADDDGRLRFDTLDDLLSERTRIVAIGHISNAVGTINPIREVVDRAHAAGAVVLVDGAQGAPHLHVDVQSLGCDFYALSGHKMCGPMGIGALWARAELLAAMPPYHGGGEMIESVSFERSTYAPPPHRFEAGTPNVAGAVGLAAAIDFLESVDYEARWAHERELTRYGLERLQAVPGLRLFGHSDPDRRIAVFSFVLDGIHPHDTATILDAQGICVRAGHHCTQPLMRRLGVSATTRASAYLYNTEAEFDRLVEGLEAARHLFGL